MSPQQPDESIHLPKRAPFNIGRLSFFLLLSCYIFSMALFFVPGLVKDPIRINHSQKLLSPNFATHIAGTDKLGRDMFSRISFGVQTTIFIGTASVVVSFLLGSALGILSGYFSGGWIDNTVIWLVDVVSSFPRIFLVIVFIAIFKQEIMTLVVVIGLTGWMNITLIVRNKILSLKKREFILSAVALGLSDLRIILRHILPNCSHNLMVALTFGLAEAILMEASLSYLGMGVREPQPSLGNILISGKDSLLAGKYLWLSIFPGATVTILTCSFFYLGDALSHSHRKTF